MLAPKLIERVDNTVLVAKMLGYEIVPFVTLVSFDKDGKSRIGFVYDERDNKFMVTYYVTMETYHFATIEEAEKQIIELL